MPSYSGGDSWRNLLYTDYKVPGQSDAYSPYGTNWTRNWPFNLMPTGDYVGGVIYYRTQNGHWWENTSGSSQTTSHYFLLSPTSGPSDGVRPGFITDRGYGYAIRCVVRS